MEEEHKNLLTELRKLGINPNRLPDNMPEDLKEAVEEVKKWTIDWDPADEDSEEIAKTKQELKKAVFDTLQLVKNWLSTQEFTISASQEKKVIMMLEDLERNAEAEGMKAKFEGCFYIKPFNMVAMKLAASANETGTVLFKPFKMVRKDFDKFWLCQRVG